MAELDRYAFALEVDDDFAYVGSRPQRVVPPGETYEQWDLRRIDLESGEEEMLLVGGFRSFSLGEAGLLVTELDPSRLTVYPTVGDPVRVCSVRSLDGAIQAGDRAVWWNYGGISVCPLDGGESTELDPDRDKSPHLVEANTTHAYWASASESEPGLSRVELSADAGTEDVVVDARPSTVGGLALDASHLYFSEAGRIRRVSLDNLATEVFSEHDGWPSNLLIHGDHVYFTERPSQLSCIKRIAK